MRKIKKRMHRLLCVFLLVALLLCCALTSCKRSEEPPAAEPPAPTPNGEDPMPEGELGQTFSLLERYLPTDPLATLPISFEAALRIPEDVTDASGVIFGNDDGHAAGISYELTSNGNPLVRWRNADGATGVCTFDQVNMCGTQKRLNIVWDTALGQLHCYVDGQLKQTLTQSLPAAIYAPTQRFVLGADMVSSGTCYFKGILKSVAAWSDVRTATEVADAKYDAADGSLLVGYDFVEEDDIMHDRSPNENDLICERLWLDGSALDEVEEYAYSFAVIGDCGGLVGKHSNRLSRLYDWLLNNKDDQKIKHVFGLGGITAADSAEEWEMMRSQTERLNGQISYSLVRGEQDGADKMNTAFGGDYATSLQGVMTEGDVTNAYQKLTVGGHKYLMMMLDVGASDTVLEWAGAVIDANADHRVILTTHIYQYHDGTTLDSDDVAPATDYVTNGNNGDAIFEKLVSKHENILLVLSSHDAWQNVVCSQVKGDAGNTVTQIMVSPQGMDTYIGATGMVAMLYFSENGEQITVRYYSTVRGQYGAESSHFTVDLFPDS